MIHTEEQRQFYLGVAGIRMWYAREPLPGAAPSPEFVFPEPEPVAAPHEGGLTSPVAEPARPAQPVPDPQGAKRIASLQALMESETKTAKAAASDDRPVPAETQPEEAPPALTREQEEPDLTLDLGIFTGAGHVLVAHLSNEASLQLQESLAANILRSLGERQLEPLKRIGWPVFNNRLVPGSSLSDLQAVIQPICTGIREKVVIVIGASTDEAESPSWLTQALGRNPDVNFGRSLADLASNPAEKRLLWKKLKPLVAT
ncbi:2-isopropylmalate synthase [Marinobacter piscensis]|uniref:2-isopropylmalate synthase n=1 Tax=Marinobacter piscensis TaxID=1562308 RepID=UPI0011A3F3BF|nr:2-isopropylmalate synthase [Marinobacter piscensis]